MFFRLKIANPSTPKQKLKWKGRLFWKNGKVRYDGDFIEGRLEGAGKLFDHEGRLLYQGEFRAGVFARGSYFNAAGEVMYEGDFPPPPLLQR